MSTVATAGKKAQGADQRNFMQIYKPNQKRPGNEM